MEETPRTHRQVVSPRSLVNERGETRRRRGRTKGDGKMQERRGRGLKCKRTVNVRPVQLLVKAPTSVQLSGAYYSASFGLVRLLPRVAAASSATTPVIPRPGTPENLPGCWPPFRYP